MGDFNSKLGVHDNYSERIKIGFLGDSISKIGHMTLGRFLLRENQPFWDLFFNTTNNQGLDNWAINLASWLNDPIGYPDYLVMNVGIWDRTKAQAVYSAELRAQLANLKAWRPHTFPIFLTITIPDTNDGERQNVVDFNAGLAADFNAVYGAGNYEIIDVAARQLQLMQNTYDPANPLAGTGDAAKADYIAYSDTLHFGNDYMWYAYYVYEELCTIIPTSDFKRENLNWKESYS